MSTPRRLIVTSSLALAVFGCGDKNDSPSQTVPDWKIARRSAAGGDAAGGDAAAGAGPSAGKSAAPQLPANAIQGNWYGHLVTPDSDTIYASLRLVRDGASGWRGSLNVPFLDLLGAPVKDVGWKDGSLTFEAGAGELALRFSGPVQDEGRSYRGRVSVRTGAATPARRGSMEFRHLEGDAAVVQPKTYRGTITLPDNARRDVTFVTAELPSGDIAAYLICPDVVERRLAMRLVKAQANSTTYLHEGEVTSMLMLESGSDGAVTGTLRRSGTAMAVQLKLDPKPATKPKAEGSPPNDG